MNQFPEEEQQKFNFPLEASKEQIRILQKRDTSLALVLEKATFHDLKPEPNVFFYVKSGLLYRH